MLERRIRAAKIVLAATLATAVPLPLDACRTPDGTSASQGSSSHVSVDTIPTTAHPEKPLTLGQRLRADAKRIFDIKDATGPVDTLITVYLNKDGSADLILDTSEKDPSTTWGGVTFDFSVPTGDHLLDTQWGLLKNTPAKEDIDRLGLKAVILRNPAYPEGTIFMSEHGEWYIGGIPPGGYFSGSKVADYPDATFKKATNQDQTAFVDSLEKTLSGKKN